MRTVNPISTLQGSLAHQMRLVRLELPLVSWPLPWPRHTHACLQGSLRFPGGLHYTNCTDRPCLTGGEFQQGGPCIHTPARTFPPYIAASRGPTATPHITLLAQCMQGWVLLSLPHQCAGVQSASLATTKHHGRQRLATEAWQSQSQPTPPLTPPVLGLTVLRVQQILSPHRTITPSCRAQRTHPDLRTPAPHLGANSTFSAKTEWQQGASTPLTG